MPQFGLMIFPTDYSIDPIILAREAEILGFESLFFPEHTHIPVNRTSPWPGGTELPRQYWHTHDPLVALGAIAAVTSTILLGTGIALVTERDPILMAKQVASLDFLSKGRVLLGIGAGWNAEEMENHGVFFPDRWKVLRERVLAMREIWIQDEAEFHGEFVNFDKIWSFPKPVQDKGPPLLLGASSAYAYKRIAEYGDGWFPIYQDAQRAIAGGGLDYADGILKTKQAWLEAEREGNPSFSIFGVPPDEKVIEHLIEIGFERLVFGLPSSDSGVVLPLIERIAALAYGFNE